MNQVDDPDYFINSIISVIAGGDPKIGKHLEHCNECKSVLTASLKTAIQDMIRNPKIQEAMNIMSRHLDHLGA